MIDLRGGILAVTICLIIYAVANQPKPVKDHQAAYCVVDQRMARKTITGEYEFAWGRAYAPCSQQDIFRNI